MKFFTFFPLGIKLNFFLSSIQNPKTKAEARAIPSRFAKKPHPPTNAKKQGVDEAYQGV
ncbi:MAG: hypothetical protein CM15mP83_0070 [Flavobacteriaceae bacterium]|nr:MAG: hypothetical protein CM15mP83_0070 [Flavobacteriaceae bacterium]